MPDTTTDAGYLAEVQTALHAAGVGAFTGRVHDDEDGTVCRLYSAVQAHAYAAIRRDTITLLDPAGQPLGAVDIDPDWTVASIVRRAMDMAGHTWEWAEPCMACGQLVDPVAGHDDLSGPCATAPAATA